MPARLYAELLTDYADNVSGNITPALLRNLPNTLEQVIKALNTTERGTIVYYGANNGRALTIQGLGPTGVSLTLVSENNLETKALEIARHPSILGTVLPRIDSRGAFSSNYELTISGNSMSSGVGGQLSCSFGADVPLVEELFGSSAVTTDLCAMIDEGKRHQGRIHVNAEYDFSRPYRGVVFRSPDNSRWLETLDDAGARVITRLSSTDVGTDAASAPAWLTTLITALGGNAVWPSVQLTDAKLIANGILSNYASVDTETDGRVTTWADARGGGFGPSILTADAAFPRSQFYWDGVAKMAVGRHAQHMKTALTSALAMSVIKSVVWVGIAEPHVDAAVVRLMNAAGHWSGILMNNGTFRSDAYSGAGIARADSGVAGGQLVRLAVFTWDGSGTYIDVPNTARVAAAAPTPAFTAADGQAIIGGTPGAFITGRHRLLMLGTNTLSEANVDTIRDAVVTNLGVVVA